MAKKERYIKLDKDKVKEIADIKGVSTVTVYAALKFQTDSALAMLGPRMGFESWRKAV